MHRTRTPRRATLATTLVTAAGLTLTACNAGSAGGPTDSTNTVSGPSSTSTQSQDEKDLADAVEVTKAYYADQVKGDLRKPASEYVTKAYVRDQEAFIRDTRAKGWTWKGERDRVVSVSPSQRGQWQVSTHVCLEKNRLAYDKSNSPVLVTQDGKPIRNGDHLKYLVTLVSEGDGWKINGGQFIKKGC